MDYDQALTGKLKSMLENEALINDANSILGAYGKEEHELEATRVKLAILKLAGADLRQIEKYTEIAKQDYRDVLAWAEYPRQSKKWSMPDGPKKEKLVKADKEEYEKWLNT